MREQLGLFGAEPKPKRKQAPGPERMETEDECCARVVREETQEQRVCQHHGNEACCTRCTSGTDGLGFPHPSQAKGRKRYQECKHCSDWVEPGHWINDIRRAWFGCIWCAYYLNHASDDQCPQQSTDEK